MSERVRVDEGEFRGAPSLILSSGVLDATFLPGLGMTGVSLRCAGREHLALPGGLARLRAGGTAGLPLLAPWANRLSTRRYRAGGVDVDLTGLDLHTDDRGLPIHGTLVGRPGWRIVRRSTRLGRAAVSAALDVDDPAFPFPHRLEVTASVRERKVTLATTVVPTGDRAVPIAFGWHPYLRLPGTPRSQWQLRLPGRTHLALDERGIPTGAEHTHQREEEPIGRRTFDDLYRLGNIRRLALVDDRVTLTVGLDRAYPYAQVWAPKGRPFAALEPMTVATDSLVKGTAPLVQPDESFTARFSITVGES